MASRSLVTCAAIRGDHLRRDHQTRPTYRPGKAQAEQVLAACLRTCTSVQMPLRVLGVGRAAIHLAICGVGAVARLRYQRRVGAEQTVELRHLGLQRRDLGHVAHDQPRRTLNRQQYPVLNRRLTGQRGKPGDILGPIVIMDGVSRAPWRTLRDVEIQEPAHLAFRCVSLELQPQRVQHLVDRPNASTDSQTLGGAFEYAIDTRNPIGGSRRFPEPSIGQARADKAVKRVGLLGHERGQSLEVGHQASMFQQRPMRNHDARRHSPVVSRCSAFSRSPSTLGRSHARLLVNSGPDRPGRSSG